VGHRSAAMSDKEAMVSDTGAAVSDTEWADVYEVGPRQQLCL
jgi:hypothetical protein